MESISVDKMLVQSCAEIGAGVIKSTLQHKMAERACFAKEKFGRRKVIGYDSGTLMYTQFYAG